MALIHKKRHKGAILFAKSKYITNFASLHEFRHTFRHNHENTYIYHPGFYVVSDNTQRRQ